MTSATGPRYDDRHPLDDLAVYALDALDPDERAAVDIHLAGCASCRDELAAHREAVAGLIEDAAPPSLWETIEAQVQASIPPRAPGDAAPRELPRSPEARRGPSRRARILLAAAAVLAAGTVGLAAGLVVGDGDRDRGAGSGSEVAGPGVPVDGRTVAVLVDPHGGDAARVVTGHDGDVLVMDGLPALPAGRTYQLWALDGPAPTSLGVLGDAAAEAVTVDLPAAVERLAISDEPAGGVVAPTGPIVASGAVVR